MRPFGRPLVRFVVVIPLSALWLALTLVNQIPAQTVDPRLYDIGQPAVVDLWLDPVNGNDSNDGSTRAKAVRTLFAAWDRIPAKTTLTANGYRINVLPGSIPCARPCKNFFADRWGTYQAPVIIRAAEGRGTATIEGGLNIKGVNYLYLIDLNLVAGGALGAFADNVLHFERVDHVLMRGLTVHGQTRGEFREVLKANQCQYLFLEESEVSTSWSTAVDFFAVNHGHLVSNRVHDAGKWGMYLKGGSAYFRVEGNEIYDAFFGFSAGEGSELTLLESPWLHYEAYDIKFINNVLHDLPGTGIAVAGGYDILIADNTLYRTGFNNNPKQAYGLVTLMSGNRICYNTADACARMTNQGAWGPELPGDAYGGGAIPNRHVYVYNNLFYNPAPDRTYYGHFVVYGAAGRPPSFKNLPEDLSTDFDLRIRGNLIWNGPANMELGIEDPSWGCQPSNPTCNATQLRADNTFNLFEPIFVNAAAGDFRLKPDGRLLDVRTYDVPDFKWDDAPSFPSVPSGEIKNTFNRDRTNQTRTPNNLPGAHTIAAAAVVSAANYKTPVAPESLVAAFGVNLATTTVAAVVSPLPTTLGGVSVTVRDSAGVARQSPLFIVSPNQINYQIPPRTAAGSATVSIEGSNGSASLARLNINVVAPGIFTADASGKGLAAASVLRVRADGSQQFERVARFDPAQNRFVAIPIDLGPAGDQVYLVLFGTGVRLRSALSAVIATIGGVDAQVVFAGAQNSFVGLDQINVRLPRSLAGRGEVEVLVTADGQAANPVRVSMR